MSITPEYDRGFKDGIRAAVTWLHNRSDEMNDPHAKLVLDAACFNLGSDFSERVKRIRRKRQAELPTPTQKQGD